MAQLSWPFENQDTTETEYSQLFTRLQNTGVSGSPSTTDLKVFADSTGMQIKVPTGFAIIRGHMYQNTAQETLALSAAASNPRIDLVVLRLDPSANSILLAVIEGTPAVSPVAPAITETQDAVFELEISRVTIPASATTISAGNVSDTRIFLGTQWGRWTNTTRPVSPILGQAGYNSTSATPEFWNGTTWAVFTPAEISAAIITSGNLSMDRIATSAITDTKLASNSVTEAKIASSAVTEAKIASGAVTTAKLSSTASVDFITAKRVFIQTATPSSSGRVTGDVWISW
jgi:hypothetical protein